MTYGEKLQKLEGPIKYKLAMEVACLIAVRQHGVGFVATYEEADRYNPGTVTRTSSGFLDWFSGPFLVELFQFLRENAAYYAQLGHSSCNKQTIQDKVLPGIQTALASPAPDIPGKKNVEKQSLLKPAFEALQATLKNAWGS